MAREGCRLGFGDSSIELMVRFWTWPQKVQVRQTQTRVILALKAACEQANISIPYPIRTLYPYHPQHEGNRFWASDGVNSGDRHQ